MEEGEGSLGGEGIVGREEGEGSEGGEGASKEGRGFLGREEVEGSEEGRGIVGREEGEGTKGGGREVLCLVKRKRREEGEYLFVFLFVFGLGGEEGRREGGMVAGEGREAGGGEGSGGGGNATEGRTTGGGGFLGEVQKAMMSSGVARLSTRSQNSSAGGRGGSIFEGSTERGRSIFEGSTGREGAGRTQVQVYLHTQEQAKGGGPATCDTAMWEHCASHARTIDTYKPYASWHSTRSHRLSPS